LEIEVVSEVVDQRDDAEVRIGSLLRILLADEQGIAETEAA